jgi:hypothetical protein
MINNDIDVFFNRVFENRINEKMFFYNYKFEHELVIEYIKKICSYEVNNFYEYIFKFPTEDELESRDIIQFSSFNDCTLNICLKIKKQGDKGFCFDDVGKILLDDGLSRNQLAYKKYGENHSKTSFELGLIQFKDHFTFLSCFGEVINDLEPALQEAFLLRLCLRIKEVRYLLGKAKIGIVDINKDFSFLSESTIIRRLSNIKKVLMYIKSRSDDVYEDIFSNILFKGSLLLN